MLVTDGGQLIRCPVSEISVTGRRTQGVWIFRVADGEKVVSVDLVGEVSSDDAEAEDSDDEGNGSDSGLPTDGLSTDGPSTDGSGRRRRAG